MTEPAASDTALAGCPVGSRPAALHPTWAKRDLTLVEFVTRRGMTVRPPSCQRHSAIDSAAHGLVAIACRCFEPRSVNLNQTPPIGSGGARRPKLVHDLRHGRSSYSEQLRKFLLRQRQDVTTNSIVDVE